MTFALLFQQKRNDKGLRENGELQIFSSSSGSGQNFGDGNFWKLLGFVVSGDARHKRNDIHIQ